MQVEALTKADWAALPDALPVMMLAFVYQNVMPVVVANLEGNVPRIRAAICLGVAIPLLMFLSWEAAILGSLPVGAAGEKY
jgi:tyrosine-specific transport protein